ncbi:N-alpha-acetyltransferase 40 [Exaiptasia diaphana]|uniref:N-alpha-acetyltransferase 40 n=1 Tax=Exaiptasia diaphana TaxID=2652724 RepID=A0A913XZ28_EXADI|nr:N-alpha-acetyltransferase 40 [Exaiptasia diaphana]
MGRKSTKGKEKKLKRKEEVAKINASQAAVDAANEVEDPFKPFTAFKSFSRNGYEESEWGWSDKKKMEEMTEDTARYLIVRDSEDKGVALSHFRFDLDENMDEVIYCYEIQVDPSFHHKGLGKFLMQILELMGHRAQMKKIVLTVFTGNGVAINFFKNCLK